MRSEARGENLLALQRLLRIAREILAPRLGLASRFPLFVPGQSPFLVALRADAHLQPMQLLAEDRVWLGRPISSSPWLSKLRSERQDIDNGRLHVLRTRVAQRERASARLGTLGLIRV